LRALGAEVRVCAPPDFAERLAGVGVPLVPSGHSVRAAVAATLLLDAVSRERSPVPA